MSIDYKQLQLLVKEAMFTGGGINEPSAPEGVPHRMPAADKDTPEQYKGDPEANNLYDLALTAREATEQLVEALDAPIYDDAYEQAFKASACLRKALNSLEGSGAHPMPDQRVVAAPEYQQRYNGGSGGDYAGGGMMGMGGDYGGLEEQEEKDLNKLGGDAGAVLDVIKTKGGSALDSALKKISDPRELTDLLTNLIDLIASEDSVNDELMKAIASKVQNYYQNKGL
tara:strand:- start:2661 stop:3341 length:681 start_codon:yes stop_codon:yes gene_type:complete